LEYFVEHSVKNESADAHLDTVNKLDTARKVFKAIIVASVVAVVLGLVLFDYLVLLILPIGIVVSVPSTVAMVLVSKKLAIYTDSFDYFIHGDIFRIVRVSKRRKPILQVDLVNIQAIGKIDDQKFLDLRQKSDKIVKAYCNKSKTQDLQYMSFRDDGKDILVLWEPSQEMLMTLKRSLPRLLLK